MLQNAATAALGQIRGCSGLSPSELSLAMSSSCCATPPPTLRTVPPVHLPLCDILQDAARRSRNNPKAKTRMSYTVTRCAVPCSPPCRSIPHDAARCSRSGPRGSQDCCTLSSAVLSSTVLSPAPSPTLHAVPPAPSLPAPSTRTLLYAAAAALRPSRGYCALSPSTPFPNAPSPVPCAVPCHCFPPLCRLQQRQKARMQWPVRRRKICRVLSPTTQKVPTHFPLPCILCIAAMCSQSPNAEPRPISSAPSHTSQCVSHNSRKRNIL